MGVAGARQLMRLLPFVELLWSVVRSAQPGDGRALEHDVRELLLREGVRSDHVPGGYTLLGVGSASGLWHQMDLEAQVADAVVVCELKAYRGLLPKNDLLCFVAATDDLFLWATRRAGRLPIVRALAGTFTTSEAERRYAAMHGTMLIEPDTIPAPLLAAGTMPFPDSLVPVPECERAAMASLVRPLQAVHRVAAGPAARGWEQLPHRMGIRSQAEWSKRLFAAKPGLAETIEVSAA